MAPTLELFVYGTLRSGEANAGRLGGCVRRRVAATVPGTLHHPGADPAWHYPVARIDPGAPGRIVGEVLSLESGPQLAEIVEMELEAGYHLVRGVATTAAGDALEVAAFSYPASLAVGGRIAGDDWHNAPGSLAHRRRAARP